MRQIKFNKAKFQMDDTGAWLMLRVPSGYRQPARAFVQEMKPDKLHIADVRLYREKRSLDANAYFWSLCGTLAAVTGIPMDAIYREYVREIGDNFDIVPVRDDAAARWKKNWEARGMGWLCEILGPSKIVGYTNFTCFYGSSTYDTAQMSRLIDLLTYDCKAHDRIVSRYNEVREQLETENLKLATDRLYTAGMKDYIDGAYRIILPTERKDFIREGQSLNHCVGNQDYFDNHMKGTRMIFFVRRVSDPETPYITMEVDMKRLRIAQLYGYGDCAAPSDVRRFADKFVRKLRTRAAVA